MVKKIYIVPLNNASSKFFEPDYIVEVKENILCAAPRFFKGKDPAVFLERINQMDNKELVAFVEDSGSVLKHLRNAFCGKTFVGLVEVPDFIEGLSTSALEECRLLEDDKYTLYAEMARDDFISSDCKFPDYGKCAYEVIFAFYHMEEKRLPKKVSGEISTMLTISSAHIESFVADMLDEEAETNVMRLCVYQKADFGWFIYNVSEALDDAADSIPSSLKECLQYAKKMEADILCIDCDGSIESELPTYEWD